MCLKKGVLKFKWMANKNDVRSRMIVGTKVSDMWTSNIHMHFVENCYPLLGICKEVDNKF